MSTPHFRTPARLAARTPFIWLFILVAVGLMALWPTIRPAHAGADAGKTPASLPTTLLRLHLESNLTGMAITTGQPSAEPAARPAAEASRASEARPS